MTTGDVQQTSPEIGVLPPVEDGADTLWRAEPDAQDPSTAAATTARPSGWRRVLVPLAVVLLTALAGVLRSLDDRSLWIDEAISWYQANLPYTVMIQDLAETDVHPPLWASVLWVAVRVLGDSETALRLPSVLAGAATVPVVYGAGKELSSRAGGLVAALLFAVSPLAVWYGAEARMYGLFMLLATASLWTLLRAVRTDRWSDWAWFTASTTLLVYTQWFALLPVAVELTALAALVLVRRRRGLSVRWLLRRAGASVATLALLSAPLVPLVVAQATAYGEGGRATSAASQVGQVPSGQEDDPLSLYTPFVNVMWVLTGFHQDDVMTTLVALWPLTLLLFLGVLGRGRSGRGLLLVGLAAIPPVVLFLAGLVRASLFEPRYYIGAVPVVVLLVSVALVSWSRRRSTVVGVALVLAGLLVWGLTDQLSGNSNPRRYDFRGSLAFVEQQAEQDDLLLYTPAYLDDVVDYYDPGTLARPLETLAQNDPPEGATVFLLQSFDDQGDVRTLVGDSRAALEEAGWTVAQRRTLDNVVVWEYVR